MYTDADTASLRSFGFVVGGTLAALSLWPAVRRGEDPWLWILTLAGVLVISALVLPRSLRLVYWIWLTTGHSLGWINTRIILVLLFYGVFTPLGLVMHVLGKDLIRRRFEPELNTYRVIRQPRPASHMKHQF